MEQYMKFVTYGEKRTVMRMIQTAEQHALRLTPDLMPRAECYISWEQATAFLDNMKERGCTPESIKSYRCNLTAFFQFLPQDKRLTRHTAAEWRDELLAHGYMPRTINSRLSAVNSMLNYLGLWEYQVPEQLQLTEEDEKQPELTRNEYMRLLSAARLLGKERTYLLIKTFAVTGMTVHELPELTVEAVQAGQIVLSDNRAKRVIHIPDCLREELLDYIRRETIHSGPVFITRNGKTINQTAVTAYIQHLATDARVEPEKCNPRCLRKLYQSTREGIQQNMILLMEQAYERLLEQEQLIVGWEEGEHGA